MRALMLLLLLLLALAACGGDEAVDEPAEAPAEETQPEEPEPEEPADEPRELGEPEDVVTGLEIPWELAFVDDDTMLITERPGRVRAVENGELRDEPVATIDVQHAGEGGLLGLAVRDDFAYVYYTAGDGNRVSRFPLGDDLSFGDEEVLLDGIPAASIHNGGRIAFGPDDMLYVTTGDAGRPELGADRDSLGGKILRLAPDGGDPEVWSWGHRNPQGLTWADDGTMYASEHGPSGEFGLCCLDEVNEIEQDGFYGWPYRIGGEQTGAEGEPPAEPRPPLAASGQDTWAPAGTAWLDGSIYVAALQGDRLLRVSAEGDVEELLEGLGRLRITTVGPDDCLYVGTSNRDGRGDPRDGDDRIVRLC